MFKKFFMYLLMVIALGEYFFIPYLKEFPLEGRLVLLIGAFPLFAINLVDVFDIENSSSVLHVHVESGDNSFRRSMLYLLCFLFLVFLPTVMMIA